MVPFYYHGPLLGTFIFNSLITLLLFEHFQADIIYHLFDRFTSYQEELKQKNRDQYKNVAVFPCKLRMLPNCIFKSRDPIVAGVVVEAGIIRPGTPLCVPSKSVSMLSVFIGLALGEKNRIPVHVFDPESLNISLYCSSANLEYAQEFNITIKKLKALEKEKKYASKLIHYQEKLQKCLVDILMKLIWL